MLGQVIISLLFLTFYSFGFKGRAPTPILYLVRFGEGYCFFSLQDFGYCFCKLAAQLELYILLTQMLRLRMVATSEAFDLTMTAYTRGCGYGFKVGIDLFDFRYHKIFI